jgi:hypothetical protein
MNIAKKHWLLTPVSHLHQGRPLAPADPHAFHNAHVQHEFVAAPFLPWLRSRLYVSTAERRQGVCGHLGRPRRQRREH